MRLKYGRPCTDCNLTTYINCVRTGRCKLMEEWIVKQNNLTAAEIAAACGVSKTIVYRVRQQLNLDRLPTVDEVKDRNTKMGRPYKKAKRHS